MEGFQSIATVDAFTSDRNTFLNTFFSFFEYLDAKGCIGKHDVFLRRECPILKYSIEDFSSLFLCCTTSKLLGFGKVETEVLWSKNPFIIIGCHFEVAGKRDLILSIDGVDDTIVDAYFLIYLMVETHLVEIGHTQKLTLRL